MRWSTRLQGIGLLMLLACHLVSSYNSQDYQIWDWRDRQRKRSDRQSLRWQEPEREDVFDKTIETVPTEVFYEDNVLKVPNHKPPEISITRWPSGNYLFTDGLITAEPSIIDLRHNTINQHLDSNSGNTDSDGDVKISNTDDGGAGRTSNINVLNVSSKDSPYALINKYFSDREDNYEEKQNAYKKAVESGEIINDIKDVEPEDVWLSDGGLLVLKGGVSKFSARNGGLSAATSDRRKWLDDPWEPLDDYQAPYREPRLPPADFIPNDTGVGVPLPPEDDNTLFSNVFTRQPRQDKGERALEENEIKSLPPTTKKKIKHYIPYKYTKETEKYVKKLPPSPSIKFDPILDEEKYINEMENFRPERRHIPQHSQHQRLQLHNPNELLLVKTKPLLVEPPRQPNLVTFVPPISHNQPLASPSPLITPPTEHTKAEQAVTTSTTTVRSNTVSSLPPLVKTTPSTIGGTSHARPPSTTPSGYYISTSTPNSYSFAFQTNYKSKPLIVKNRARGAVTTLSPVQKEEVKHEINTSKRTIPFEQITTPMYTTPNPLTTASFFNPIITTTSPPYKPAPPRITIPNSTPISISVHGNYVSPSTATTIKVVPQKTKEAGIVSKNVYKKFTSTNKQSAKTKYRGKGVTSINSIYTTAKGKKSSDYSSSFPNKVSSPYYHLPRPHVPDDIFPPTNPSQVVTSIPTVPTLPARDPATIFHKLSREFPFGKKLFPTEQNRPTAPSSNEIFTNEIDNDLGGARRRVSIVESKSHHTGRNRGVRKSPYYHFTVGNFPSNPFLAFKRKFSARNKKDKRRPRQFFRPWNPAKLASDSVTVATNAISKLARPPTPTTLQRQGRFRQRSHHSGKGDGNANIYVTRRPRYLSSVRRSGHGYASFFCGGKGCKSWGYSFRA